MTSQAREAEARADRLLEAQLFTVELIRDVVSEIRHMAYDAELAHSAEDDLHKAVLKAIAAGRCADPAACAHEALKTDEIEFPRWCA